MRVTRAIIATSVVPDDPGRRNSGKNATENSTTWIGEADRQRLAKTVPCRMAWFPARGTLRRRRAQQLQPQPAQVRGAEPLQRLKQQGVGLQDGGEAGHGRNHEQQVADERSEHRAEPGADAVPGGGAQDGKRAGARDQLEDDDCGQAKLA